MKKAIQKAIEGGYKLPNLKDETAILLMALAQKEKTFLDPLFWQALGKAEGWGTSCWHYSDRGLYEQYRHKAVCGLSSARAQWQIQWHRFINHLAEGTSSDSFFEELLK